MPQVFVFDDPGGSPKRGLAGLAVLLGVVLGAFAMWHFDPLRRPPAAAGDPTGSYTCAWATAWGEPDPAVTRERRLELCRREAADAGKRRPIAQPTSPGPDPRAMRVYLALDPAVCENQAGSRCGETRPAVSTDVSLVATVLTAQGFPGAEVRLARGIDPAPDGSVVYGVRLPDGTCLVGYADTGLGAGVPRVVGPLPGGGCLA